LTAISILFAWEVSNTNTNLCFNISLANIISPVLLYLLPVTFSILYSVQSYFGGHKAYVDKVFEDHCDIKHDFKQVAPSKVKAHKTYKAGWGIML
jgi:hypothetical protein